MDWWSSQDPDVCSHFRDSIKMFQVLVLLVAALSWMLCSVSDRRNRFVCPICVCHTSCKSGTDHWEAVLLTVSCQSVQLSLSSQDLQKQVFFQGKTFMFRVQDVENQKPQGLKFRVWFFLLTRFWCYIPSVIAQEGFVCDLRVSFI